MESNDKVIDFKGSVKRLFLGLKPFLGQIIVISFCSVFSVIFTIVGPKVLGNATTELYEGVLRKINGVGGIDFNHLYKILLVILVLYVISFVFNFFKGFLMAKINQKFIKDLRSKVVSKISKLPIKYFDKKNSGEILSLINNDIDVLNTNLSVCATEIISCVVAVLGILIMMASINFALTLITLVILPLSIVISGIIMKKTEHHFSSRQDSLAKVNSEVSEILTGHNVIKAFGREDKIVDEFSKICDDEAIHVKKSQFLAGIMEPIMAFISNISYIVIAIIGGVNVIKGKMSVGEIQSFITYTKNFTSPIGDLASILGEVGRMVAASERIFAFLDEEEEVQGECIDSIHVDGDVVFKNVSFGYDPNNKIIDDFSVNVSKGMKVAIVGETGSGKTTLVKLLMRFYDVDDGEILVDGVNVNKFSREDLRRNFGMVLQDTWLFSGSIKENLRYGNVNASDSDIIEASKKALSHDFVMNLSLGYDTVLNEELTNLSGGQKQLLTIARAILRDPKILILDEATSSVDTRTEGLISKAMDNLMKGRTSFIIAHRLSTIKNADMILVLDNGRIVESGTHDELLNRDGKYAIMYNSQFKTF